ncbi:HAMP domain-containing sensor histidine kinase [uncultured Bacteroides sp.]|jgi:two-component system sensor histidine kinase ArlS|uniref:sensor histidine kinase n=1 Tax=uncultured Bacteroides sp. TaxID=162156 RepID=UPI00258E72E8|nr:HAMP domain-containing sensor histidine kinase [uncultured Bacteroides sp.]
MKVGSKIALFYTLASVLTTVIIIAVFYIFSTQYINRLYASYLREKAYLTAQKHWEKDEVDEQSYQIIQRKYDELLPEAHEILLNMDSLSEVRDTLNKYLTQQQQALLIAGEDSIPFSFKYKDQLGAALYYPDNEGNFIVLVMSRNAYGTEIQEHLLLLSIFLVLFSSILIYFIGKIYSGRILVPLQHILKELKRIRANSLNRRLKQTGNNDELEEIIVTLNHMLDRLDSAFKAEKSFVSHASHELNNPITAIQGECEISLLKERSTGEYVEALQRISSESKRLSNLIRHLLFLSRQDEELLKTNIEEISLQDMLTDLTADNDRIRLHTRESGAPAAVQANSYLLKIALKNIIDNACKYSEKEVDIILSRINRQVVIEIEDRGIGIPQEEIEHIFQSFYRGSNTHDYAGQGIGLSLTMKIISAYHGKLEISSEIEKGTKVRVIF